MNDLSMSVALPRKHQLDYLRGLAAFSIMVFHYTTWCYGDLPASSFLSRLGYYGVSLFYVLSGLTLFLAYQNKLISMAGLRQFLIRRVFRIYPLLGLATLATIPFIASWDLKGLLLNISGLFGFVQWDQYIATGAWSIGNELVFYVLFPFLIVIHGMDRKWLIPVLLGSIALLIWFAWFRIDPLHVDPKTSWKNYVNPLNQVFFFIAGICIGAFTSNWRFKPLLTWLLICGILSVFIFYPADYAERTQLIFGVPRLLFSGLSVLLVFAFYHLTMSFPSLLHQSLSWLGEASYSVYLLHPLVFYVASFLGLSNDMGLIKISLLIFVNLIASYFVFRFYEKPFMRIGKRVSDKA